MLFVMLLRVSHHDAYSDEKRQSTWKRIIVLETCRSTLSDGDNLRMYHSRKRAS